MLVHWALSLSTINPFLLLIPFSRLFFFDTQNSLNLFRAVFSHLLKWFFFLSPYCVYFCYNRLPFFIIITILFTYKCIIYDFIFQNHFFSSCLQSNGIQTDEWLMKTLKWNHLIATSFSLLLCFTIHFIFKSIKIKTINRFTIENHKNRSISMNCVSEYSLFRADKEVITDDELTNTARLHAYGWGFGSAHARIGFRLTLMVFFFYRRHLRKTTGANLMCVMMRG